MDVPETPRSSCNHIEWAGAKDFVDSKGKKQTRWHTVTCDKVTEPGQEYCPHHILLYAEAQAEIDRKMEKVRRGKARKKLLRDMLVESPLSIVPVKTDHREAE